MVGFTKVENSWKNKSFYIRWSLGSRPRKGMHVFSKCHCFLKDENETGVFPLPPTAALVIFSETPDGGIQSYSSTAFLVEHLFVGQWDPFIHLYHSFSSLQTANPSNVILASQ